MRWAHAHRHQSRRWVEQAFQSFDERIHDIANTVDKVFRLFGHLHFIMGPVVTLSTPGPILLSNCGLAERRCMFI